MLDTLTPTTLQLRPELAPRPQPQPWPAAYMLGDRFVLRRRERLLLADGAVPVELGSRAVEILLALVEADGALLTKDALLDRVWPGVTVEENNLQVQVSAIRRALGPESRGWIATVPGRGYRFTGPVATVKNGEAVVRQACVPAARPPEKGELPPPLSVLVLPFAERGGDPARAWFADGITDSLTTDLARTLPGSTVIAQAIAEAYKDHPADVREIGGEQGVRYVLEGSVLQADERVRVNAQLVAAGTGAHVWAERFDTPRHDVLQAQDAIVGRLARAVGLGLIEAEARRAEQVEQEYPGASTAENYVLRAQAAASRYMTTRESIEAACALYAQALERDPDNADALAGLARHRVYQVVNGYLDEADQTRRDGAATREGYLAEAEEKLARALAVAPGHLRALLTRAMLLRAHGLFADAVAAAEVVLAHTPDDPLVHRETGLNLLYLGRAEEAVAWFQRADALGPGDPARWTWLQLLGRALIQLGRDREAVEALRLAVASNPSFAPTHALLAAALALAGDDLAAWAVMAQFRRAEPETSMEALVRRCAVLFEATAPLCQGCSARVLEGLRRAAATVAADPSSAAAPI